MKILKPDIKSSAGSSQLNFNTNNSKESLIKKLQIRLSKLDTNDLDKLMEIRNLDSNADSHSNGSLSPKSSLHR